MKKKVDRKIKATKTRVARKRRPSQAAYLLPGRSLTYAKLALGSQLIALAFIPIMFVILLAAGETKPGQRNFAFISLLSLSLLAALYFGSILKWSKALKKKYDPPFSTTEIFSLFLVWATPVNPRTPFGKEFLRVKIYSDVIAIGLPLLVIGIFFFWLLPGGYLKK